MAKVFKIQGLDDCLKCMDTAPRNVLKITRNALRDAGRTTARQIRIKTPGRWRRLVSSKVVKGMATTNLYALVGYFNRGQKKSVDSQASDWFKAYWANYGTLTRRDPSHHFANAVKPRVRGRRNNVGQAAENFFEHAIEGWDRTFFDSFSASMKRQESTLYER